MRSGVTAGLSPQQLLDRRRAQNKLAQRRFREKAKQTRTSRTSFSELSASSSSTSSPYNSPSAQFSRVSDATSSPEVSNTERASSIDSAFIPSNEGWIPHLAKSDISSTMANFSLAEISSCFSKSTASSDPTYTVLAAKAGDSGSLVTLNGLRGDPFLTSLPMPSPSLLTEATSRTFASNSSHPDFDYNTASSFKAPDLTPTSWSGSGVINKNGSDLYERRASLTFEQFLRSQTPLCLRPEFSEASSYFSDVSTLVTPPLSASLSESSQEAGTTSPDQSNRANSSSIRATERQQAASNIEATPNAKIDDEPTSHFPMVVLNAMSYPHTLKLMVQDSGTQSRLPMPSHHASSTAAKSLALWQHLKAPKSSQGPHTDDVKWDSMPSNMLPTTEQQLCPHHRCIDLGLPWPSVRSRLLKLSMTDRLCHKEFLLDILLSLVIPEQRPSFFVYGDDPFDPESWEISQSFAAKWSGLFDDSILQRSSWWRRQRGLSAHTLPTPPHNASAFVRQGLGTGSIDMSSRIWSSAFPSLPLHAYL